MYTLSHILNSNFMQSLVIIISPAFIAWLGVKSYYSQQRINRLQKIYYEDSLVHLLNNIDGAMETTKKNLHLFENAIYLIDHLNSKPFTAGSNVLLEQLANTISNIEIPLLYSGCKIEILLELFGKTGYSILQWISKLCCDFKKFNLSNKKILHNYLDRLSAINNFPIPPLMNNEIATFFKKIELEYASLQRHFTLLYIYNKMINRISIMHFKSKKDLKKFRTDTEMKNLMKTFCECFKVLFAYYKISDNLYYTYAENEQGQRYKLTFAETKNLVTIENENIPNLKNLILIEEDFDIAYLFICNDLQKTYISHILLGLANRIAFSEEPQFLKVQRFFSKN